MKGHRVAHKSIDDPVLGTARSGRVREVYDLGDHSLVEAEYDDGEEVLFDKRELVDLGPEAHTNKTPVILRPKHLIALLRNPVVAVYVVLTVALIAGSVFYFMANGVGPFSTVGVAFGLLVFSFGLSKATETERLRRNQTRG